MSSSETDERILTLLIQNANLTYKEMARKLKLNESTVRKRVLALEKKRVIRGYIADVDTERLGLKTNVALGLEVDATKILSVGKRISVIPEARMVFNTSGAYDFIVVMWTKDRDSLMKIMNEISGLEGVSKVTPSFLLERLK